MCTSFQILKPRIQSVDTPQFTIITAGSDVPAAATPPPNYRPPSTNLPKKERDERRHAKATHAWHSGAHQLVEEQPE